MSNGAIVANALCAGLLFAIGLSLAVGNSYLGLLILGCVMMLGAVVWVVAMGIASSRARARERDFYWQMYWYRQF